MTTYYTLKKNITIFLQFFVLFSYIFEGALNKKRFTSKMENMELIYFFWSYGYLRINNCTKLKTKT